MEELTTNCYSPQAGRKAWDRMTTNLAPIQDRLTEADVAGITIVWADNNGIPRSRTVPIAGLADAAERGVGMSPLFAVFDSRDGITFAHSGLSDASGDIRLLPVMEHVTPLAGQPGFAWAPGRQLGPDGEAYPYDQRSRLEAQVARAAAAGLSVRAGFELEFYVSQAGDEPTPASQGPAYGPSALLQVDEFAAAVLRDLAANGVPVGQFHAEYGLSQLEVSLGPADPVTAADRQLLARQTIHAAARAHGLRVSFAPLVTLDGPATASICTYRSAGAVTTCSSTRARGSREVTAPGSSAGWCGTCRRSPP